MEFTDIFVESSVPLHSSLAEDASISVRLMVDEELQAETPFGNGNNNVGLWEMNTNLQTLKTGQSASLIVVTQKQGCEKEIMTVSFSTPTLLEQVKRTPDAYYHFSGVPSDSSTNIIIHCSIRASEVASPRVPDPSTQAHALNRIGRHYLGVSVRDDSATDLERAIYAFEKAISLTAASDPRFADRASNLATSLNCRYERVEDPADLGNAIALFENALKATDDNDPERRDISNSLCGCIMSQFRRFGNVNDLNRAIEIMSAAFGLNSRSNVSTPLYSFEGSPDGLLESSSHVPAGLLDEIFGLNNLGNVLRVRFERLGNVKDLDEAVSYFERALKLMPDRHLGRPMLLRNLGNTLQVRFKCLGRISDLDQAILVQRTAINRTPDGSEKLFQLEHFGNALQLRFERHGNIQDIDEAISCIEAATNATNDDLLKPSRLNSLGDVLRARFKRTGNIVDLSRAFQCFETAVNLLPEGHPGRPFCLSNLGIIHRLRFERFSDNGDLNKSITMLQTAFDLTPEDHPSKAAVAGNLGNSIMSRFESLGNDSDLNEAISCFKAAVKLTPEKHLDKPSRFGNLGIALLLKFEYTNTIADLENCISLFQTAVNRTPHGHPSKPLLLCNLGNGLQMRFVRLNSIKNLDEAILYFNTAVRLTPDDHPERPLRLNNLGNLLRSRYQRHNNLTDLDQAIRLQKTALNLVPLDHINRAALLSNGASSFQLSFRHFGGLPYLERAISLHKRALDLTPDTHPNRPEPLRDLGEALQLRFEHLGIISDLDEAISHFQAAINLMPDSHPDKPAQFFSLGSALYMRFQYNYTRDELKSAISALSTAAKSSTGVLMMRFRAAIMWASICPVDDQSPMEAFGIALHLLPRIAWIGLTLVEQRALLGEIGSVVRDAVSAAIKAKELETAVEWVEQGRSIIWQNMLGLRSPLDDLRRAHPKLAARFQRVSQKLEGYRSNKRLSADADEVTLVDVARKSSRLATEWEGVIDEIRRLPNFEWFLGAKRFDKLACVAVDGPVVILNVQRSRCDALALMPGKSKDSKASVTHIPLANFSQERSEELSRSLTKLLISAGVRFRDSRKSERLGAVATDENFAEILSILWLQVVKPVLDGLGYQPRTDNLPRIWWCATGPLAFLPIHAAGLYDTDKVGEKLSDYVISSYTPSLTALLEKSQPVVQDDFQILAVAQPSTPHAKPLPGTVHEVERIEDLASGLYIEALVGEDATVDRVLESMKKSNWIHLACHGEQDLRDPMQSGFLLQDGRLTLSIITREPMPRADFAFLSACQTATGDQKVAEEVMHLAGGMLFSGCQGVIATMWSIEDDDAPKVAEDVYKHMLKKGQPKRTEAAHALHGAVERLRKSNKRFVSWVPFIHLGR